jgi:hypothetical protein
MEDIEELFRWLKSEINKKYGINNPIFILNNHKISESEIIDWVSQKYLEHKWVKYKKISNNTFELKDYFPDPSDEACNRIVSDFVWEYEGKGTKVLFKINQDLYNLKEAHKQLFLFLKIGFSTIFGAKVETILDRNNKNISVMERDPAGSEIFHQVDSGYLEFEYKN